MIDYLKIYLVTLVTFFTIDLLWIGIVANKLYKKYLGFVLAENPNWTAAMIFYLLYILGMVFFVIHPALEKQSWKDALYVGMFFGLITYATYDLTNLATLKNWPVTITIIDLIWGVVLSGSVSLVTYIIVSNFLVTKS
jgi:uncharacterized membrane protein